MAKPQYQRSHQSARAELLDGDPLCVHCGEATATVADHQPPIALWRSSHGDAPWEGELVPSCAACSYRQAGEVSRAVAGTSAPIEVVFDEPDDSPGPESPIWDGLEWVADLRDVPDDASWPRFMSGPHPRATGSYRSDFEAFALARDGFRPYWWQSLVAGRLLEHDDAGRLVWLSWLLTVARQVGKSRLIAEILVYLLERLRDLFPGAEQCLYVSKSLATADAITLPLLRFGDLADGYKAGRRSGTPTLHRFADDGAELMLTIRAIGASYGSTNGIAVADEAWSIQSTDISEGVRPTLLATEGQLGLVSTAHRSATSLMLNERKRAFAELAAPTRRLLLEWSTPRNFAHDDVEGWRRASPRWTEFRSELISDALGAAEDGEVLDPTEPDPVKAFEAQYLNRWPIRQTRRGAGDPLFEAGQWAGALHTDATPRFHRTAVVNDNFGNGASVLVAGLTADERVAVSGVVFDTVAEAFGYVSALDELSDILVGATLIHDAQIAGAGSAKPQGSTQLRLGLPIMRQLVNVGMLVHDGSPDLSAQVLDARTRNGSSGLTIVSRTRSDLVRSMSWGVAHVHAARSTSPSVW